MTNQELLTLMRKDLPQGLDWVVRECRDKCLGFAKKTLLRTGDREELDAKAYALFSEALLAFADHVEEGRLTDLSASVSTYLCSTMKFTHYGHQRKAKRPPLTFSQVNWDSDEDISEEREFVRQALRRLIRELGVACKQLLTLRYYDNLPYADILELTGEQYASVNVLRNKSSKCMKSLRSKVNESVPVTKISS
jgi:RNA polymerase sigma factor (sigma-70 family)